MVYLYTKTNEELSSFDETISVVQSGINGSANILFSTENRRCFRELEHIKCSCNPGDIIIISNFESLGMNDTDIKENLDFFIQNSIKLVIKDIPSTYEYGVGTSTNIAVIRTIFDLIKSTNQKITPIRTSSALAPVVLNWIFQKAGKNYTQNGSKKKSHQVNL